MGLGGRFIRGIIYAGLGAAVAYYAVQSGIFSGEEYIRSTRGSQTQEYRFGDKACDRTFLQMRDLNGDMKFDFTLTFPERCPAEKRNEMPQSFTFMSRPDGLFKIVNNPLD